MVSASVSEEALGELVYSFRTALIKSKEMAVSTSIIPSICTDIQSLKENSSADILPHSQSCLTLEHKCLTF